MLLRQRPLNKMRLLDSWGKEQDMFSRLLDDLSHFHGASQLNGIENPNFSPSLNLTGDKNKYTILIELPGIEKDKIDININDGTLIIKGEKKEEVTEETEEKYVSECFYGSFRREIDLPSDCNIAEIEATNQNGILTINIPKTKEETKEIKKISIQ